MAGVAKYGLLSSGAIYIGTVLKDLATTNWQILTTNAELAKNAAFSMWETTANSTNNATSSIFQNATEALRNTTASAFETFFKPENISETVRDTLNAGPADGLDSGSFLGKAWSLLSGAASWTYWGWNLLPDSAKLILGVSLFFFILSRRTSVNVVNHTHVHLPNPPAAPPLTSFGSTTPSWPPFTAQDPAAQLMAYSQWQQQQASQMSFPQTNQFPQTIQKSFIVVPSQLNEAEENFIAKFPVNGRIRIPELNIDMKKVDFLNMVKEIKDSLRANPDEDLELRFETKEPILTEI